MVMTWNFIERKMRDSLNLWVPGHSTSNNQLMVLKIGTSDSDMVEKNGENSLAFKDACLLSQP